MRKFGLTRKKIGKDKKTIEKLAKNHANAHKSLHQCGFFYKKSAALKFWSFDGAPKVLILRPGKTPREIKASGKP